MDIAVWIIVAGLALIDGKLWAVMLEQRRHNQAVEQLLGSAR